MQEVEVDSSLEYKALPSGLHNVEQDLVYAALRSLCPANLTLLVLGKILRT